MVGGPNGVDEMDCGSFFDHIDDLLDFPGEDIDTGLPGSLDSFPSIWSTQSDSLPGSDSVFSNNGNSDLSAELSVPYEDIVQLEWLSTFVEDSFSGGGSLTMKKQDDSASNNKEPFHSTSPVSVLESSSSYCYGDKPGLRGPEPSAGKRGRARSKRPRPATFNPRPAIQLMSPTTSGTTLPPQVSPKAGSSDSENYAESRPVMIKIPKKQSGNVEEKKKKKKIKLTVVPGSAEVIPNQSPQAVRKCLHCEITKTPQWRAGPLGPKTLCNACGVRYKSGRLFPEYRPAASPTFVPSVHSNSHKKVIEMRTRMGEPTDQITAPKSTMPASPELIPNTAVPLDYM